MLSAIFLKLVDEPEGVISLRRIRSSSRLVLENCTPYWVRSHPHQCTNLPLEWLLLEACTCFFFIGPSIKEPSSERICTRLHIGMVSAEDCGFLLSRMKTWQKKAGQTRWQAVTKEPLCWMQTDPRKSPRRHST